VVRVVITLNLALVALFESYRFKTLGEVCSRDVDDEISIYRFFSNHASSVVAERWGINPC
jgi:hypothetical protein